MCAVFAMTGVHYVFHTVKPDALSALLMQILCHFYVQGGTEYT